MCGIWFCTVQDDRQSQDATQHFQKLANRGPDFTELSLVSFADSRQVLLGFHRLAIVGLGERGNQPFTHGHKAESVFVCSGEIYNWRQLASTHEISDSELRSDVDIICRMLDNSTDIGHTLSKLDGDWAFISVDKDSGTVTAGRDPLGVRPLFYGLASGGEVIAIASEAKGLIGLARIDSVHIFPPGTWWSSRTDVRPTFHPYSDVFPAPGETTLNVGRDEATATVRRLLEEAVRKRVQHTEVPLGFLCSGGLDSSAVVAIAQNMVSEPHSFSMAMRGSARSHDAQYASLLTSTLGIDHTSVQFNGAEISKVIQDVIRTCETHDPQTIRASIPMFLLARYIRQHTPYRVVLSGEGADEIFGGYSYFSRAPSPQAAREETERLLKNLYSFDLLRADRCFAAHGLEIRVPYLDKDLIRYVLRLPHDITKNPHGVEKYLLRRSLSDIDSLCRTRIIERGKERFSDGVSFGYVPHLLRSISPDYVGLESGERDEKEHYATLFDEMYGTQPRALVLPRVMPDWIPSAKPKNAILGPRMVPQD